MASSLPDLSRLAAHPSVPTGASTFYQPGSKTANLYIVADMLNDEKDRGVLNDPLLMLFRHSKQHAYGVTVVPWEYDGGISAMKQELMRGFARMRLNLESANMVREASREILAMTGKSALEKLQDHTDRDDIRVISFRLRVPRTSVFEALLSEWNPAFNPSASVEVKRVTPLAPNTPGYVWVRKSALEEAMRNPTLNRDGQLQVRDTNGGTLWIRHYLLGKSKNEGDGPWEPGPLLVVDLFRFDD